MGKRFVSVIAKFTEDGQVVPLSIEWEDGRSFPVDKVLNVCRAASLKAGGIGMRYTCRIRHKQVHLFRDEDAWFMETEG